MFSFWFSSMSVYMYTLSTNTNTVWKLNKGDSLHLAVPAKGMRISIYRNNYKTQKGFDLTIINEMSSEYATITSKEIQEKPIKYINFCSTTGKILVEATEDIELRIVSSSFDPNSNSNTCPGPISLTYGPTNEYHTSEDGFDFIFESLPAIGSFLIFMLFLAMLSYIIYSICTKASRKNDNSAVPPILDNQFQTDNFNQYIPPHHEKTNQLQPVQYAVPQYQPQFQYIQQPVQNQYGQPIIYSRM